MFGASGDEATSHLDVEREQSVNAASARLAMTRIIIAHRRETILSSDRIILFSFVTRPRPSCSKERQWLGSTAPSCFSPWCRYGA
jgi:ABC-type uncharacterized transport system fused permease/ATPase subunit